MLVAVWAYGVSTAISGAPEPLVSVQPDVQTEDELDEQADALGARWERDYAEQGLYTRTAIELRFSRAFSKQFTEARGTVELSFQTGRVSVSVDGLDLVQKDSAYEVWLIDQVPGPQNTAAIDLGAGGDRILNLGALRANGSLVTSIKPETLAARAIDMAVVMRVAPDRQPEYVIGGMQSIRVQIGRQAYVNRGRFDGPVAAAGFNPTIVRARFNLRAGPRLALVGAQGGGSKKQLAALIAQGRDLFLNGTFGGNGRTCSTCHRLEHNLSMDSPFIATLPPTDPLFVAEFDANLPDFDADNPTRPAMEDAGTTGLMRTRGLTLENIRGFAVTDAGDLVEPPVFRTSPSLFNLEFTAPYGLSDCCPNLQDFSAGAVVQHFTKTLGRVPGVDFVLPTAVQLQALEAFQLSNTSPANRNFKISGRNSLLSTAADPRATNTSRPEVRGRDLFLSTGSCVTCHLGTVLSGGVVNLNTGIEAFEHDPAHANATPTTDTGDGSGLFQIPQLFGLRNDHFFHAGSLGNSTVGSPGSTERRFANLRAAVSFYVSPAFAASPEGQTGNFASILALSPTQLDDIARFLVTISNP